MKVVIVPVLEDNYSYLLIDEKAAVAAAVDPVEPEKVLAAAKKENVKVEAILTTHHHWDHASGNKKMLELIPGLPVYGGDERIDALNKFVKQDDTISVGSLQLKVHFTPCHTTGHVLYEVTGSEKALFTGDTLFVGGCGKFFEGNPQQMHHALVEVVRSLPDETKIYPGHEYTQSNLKFALSIEPENKALQEKAAWVKERRDAREPTVPSTIGEEKATNPFMRCVEQNVAQAVGLFQNGKFDPVEVMGELRKRKNNFK